MLMSDNVLFQKDINLKPISQWLMFYYQIGKNDPMSQSQCNWNAPREWSRGAPLTGNLVETLFMRSMSQKA
jgi:hypothetical protein